MSQKELMEVFPNTNIFFLKKTLLSAGLAFCFSIKVTDYAIMVLRRVWMEMETGESYGRFCSRR
jgi:hypothetical protein